MISDVYQSLDRLRDSSHTFQDIYENMRGQFDREVFSEEIVNGLISSKTYSELFDDVDSAAETLLQKYPDPALRGRFIGIQLTNSERWAAVFWGILKAGFRPFLINHNMDQPTIRKVLDNASVLAVVSDEPDSEISAAGLFGKQGGASRWENEIGLLSSGTTGIPKTIIFNGQSITEQILLSGDILKQNPTIRYNDRLEVKLLAFLPFYHIFGLVAVLLWFSFFGRTFVFPSSQDANAIQYACKCCNVSHFFGVPLVWESVSSAVRNKAEAEGKLKKLERAIGVSISVQQVFPAFGKWLARKVLFKEVRKKVFGETVSFCISGGGFIRAETLRFMTGLGYTLHNGYGMTEIGIASVELSEKPSDLVRTSVGVPFACVETESRNGVLYIRSRCSFAAQIKDGVRTERNPAEDFFCTDDMVEFDPDGRLHVLGRRDDMIIGMNGENVNPDMVESKLQIPEAEVFTVVGVHVNDNIVPVLVIQYRSGIPAELLNASLESVFRQIESSLAKYERPRSVYWTGEKIPMRNGKVLRRILREMIEDRTLSLHLCKKGEWSKEIPKPAAEYDDILEDVKEMILRTIKDCEREQIEDHTHFIYDLGGDSMEYFQLISAVSEKYAVNLLENGMEPVYTPKDITERILQLMNTH